MTADTPSSFQATTCGPGDVRPKLGDRSGFGRLSAAVYLNHAAISPPSDAVCERSAAAMADFASRGTGAFPTWAAQRETLRQKLASLIGAAPEDIAFLPNTSVALDAVALSIPFRKGDRVIVFEGEYPSNVVPFQAVAERLGLQLVSLPLSDFARPEGPSFAGLEAELARGVRLVAVSAVEFQTGLRMPLDEIGRRVHAAGGELCVDGVQACGAVPVSVAGGCIDYLACGSHKWLMGPAGAGFLYIHPRARAGLKPALVGCMSYEGATDMLFAGPGHLSYGRPLRSDGQVFEGGMLNFAGYAALEAALDPILALGVPAIHAHVNRYLDAVEPMFVARGFRSLRAPDPERRSCTLSFVPPPGVTAPQLVERFSMFGVQVSSPDGALRIAPHWPNGLSEIPTLADALARAVP